MKYFRARWIQNDPGFPVLFYSELDDERWETRKVEIYADGRKGLADADREINGSRLGRAAVPEIAVINADLEFEAVEIGADEFEQVWTDAEKSH